MDNEKLISKIFFEIQKDPSDYRAYEDVFSLCRSIEESDFKLAHDTNAELRSYISRGMKTSAYAKLFDLYRRSLLFDAPYKFDSYLLYIEINRKPEERFYQPRRRILKQVVDNLQKLVDDELDELFISMPPRVGKTTILMFFVTWLIGRNSESSNLYSAYSDTITKAFYNGVLETIQDPVTYLWKDVFPSAKVVQTNSADETLNIDRMGGSMSITGWPGSEPTRAGMAIGDLFGGLNAGFAICASLYNREKTGVGNHIDVALVDSIFSGMEAKMMQYVYTGVSPVKTGNKYITSAPYDSFKAKDDYFVIASGTDKHFEKLSAAMGMPELAQDPLYCDTESRKKNADSLKEIIEKWTADKTVSEVCKIIDEAGIPVAPIYNCEQAANDKNIVEVREMLVKVPAPVKHPDAPKELTVIGNPLKMEEAPCVYYKAAPDLGENNEEIFESLGFTKEQLEAFRAEGVIN